MEIRTFLHESVVTDGRRYFVPRTLNNIGFGTTYLANPEEHVRQDVIRTLHEDYGYPYNLMIMELALANRRRIDLEIMMPSIEQEPEPSDDPFPFSGGLIPYIIVECKKGTERLNDDHIVQGLDYARMVRPDYLIVTNGNMTRCFRISLLSEQDISYKEVSDIPKFSEVLKEPWIPKDFDLDILTKWLAEDA